MEIIPLGEAHFSELYEILCSSFEQNLDTYIPPFKEWVLDRRANSDLCSWGYRCEGRLVGFVNVRMGTGLAEIRTLGVLPDSRGLGIGRALLAFALNQVAKAGGARCELTVATQNENALKLYRELGFTVTDRYRVFARDRRGR